MTMTLVEEGKRAPNFELPADNGETIKLSKLQGGPVVLFFYPKDDTSGCTKEAIAFSELQKKFSAAGAKVFGISPDGLKKHLKFREKHDLTVPLISDEEKIAAQAYGVWVEKSMYGRKYMGIERSTFLIGKSGKVVKAWRKVKVPGHAEAVLEAVNAL